MSPQPTSKQSRACRNCGQVMGPRFCGHCGQAADDRRRPLLGILGELLDDWFSLDSRLVRSLATLLRPGQLTVLHRDGKRAPYLRPLRLYVLASLAVFSTVLTLDPPDASTVDLYLGGELISEATATDGPRRTVQIIDPDSFFGRRLETAWADRFERFRQQPPQELLDSLFGSLRRYLPAALILFVPFLAAALKLVYLRSKILYMDHLVFALHFQGALFFALATSWLICRILGLGLGQSLFGYVLTGLLMMTVYLGMALGRFYGQRWWWTTAKTLLLTVLYSQILSFFFGLAVMAAIRRA